MATVSVLGGAAFTKPKDKPVKKVTTNIARMLGFRPKDHIDNDDWLAIVKTGDEKTLKKVLKYNKKDVEIGKDVLNTLLKYSGKRTEYGARTFEFMLKGYSK